MPSKCCTNRDLIKKLAKTIQKDKLNKKLEINKQKRMKKKNPNKNHYSLQIKKLFWIPVWSSNLHSKQFWCCKKSFRVSTASRIISGLEIFTLPLMITPNQKECFPWTSERTEYYSNTMSSWRTKQRKGLLSSLKNIDNPTAKSSMQRAN